MSLRIFPSWFPFYLLFKINITAEGKRQYVVQSINIHTALKCAQERNSWNATSSGKCFPFHILIDEKVWVTRKSIHHSSFRGFDGCSCFISKVLSIQYMQMKMARTYISSQWRRTMGIMFCLNVLAVFMDCGGYKVNILWNDTLYIESIFEVKKKHHIYLEWSYNCMSHFFIFKVPISKH